MVLGSAETRKTATSQHRNRLGRARLAVSSPGRLPQVVRTPWFAHYIVSNKLLGVKQRVCAPRVLQSLKEDEVVVIEQLCRWLLGHRCHRGLM